MKVQLMNVSRQYLNHKNEFDEKIQEVLSSGNYIGGKIVTEFEERFASKNNANYCVSCGNGTDALVLALKALGIKEGDEVITISFTFFATAEAISYVGATPVFIDVDPKTYCMNPDLIEDKITSKTKAIIPVHLYGNVCEMDRIMQIAKKHNLYVVEDCAQSTFCKYKDQFAGTFGDIGCFSFFPTKLLGCAGDGGALLTNNPELEYKIRAYKAHGSGISGYKTLCENKDVPTDIKCFNDKYHNYVIGQNSRLDAIQAAILLVKMKYIDGYISKRREIATKYYEKLKNKKDIVLPYVSNDVYHGYYVFAIVSENVDKYLEIFNAAGIETHTYYPVPMHLEPAYYNLNYKEGDLPVTEYLATHSFAIPVYPELENEEIQLVIDSLLQ